MKRIFLSSTLLVAIATSCQHDASSDAIVSQKYVHKYGFETTPEEWETREKDGQVVTALKNGVTITSSYEGGKLHGAMTYSFPHSSVVEKLLVYDQGTLLRESLNDTNGMPIREEVYEFDRRTLVTLWDEKGVPLSIEEYEGSSLLEGKYFTPNHDLEATTEAGQGSRIKRDRTGLLISNEKIENGNVVSRTTYHPNGNIHTVSNYEDSQLHGEQLKFTASGKPLMELQWNHGTLDGSKTVYRNGSKIAVIPYVDGKKNGTELHYDDLGNLTAEITWRDDKKHGTTYLHSEEATETEWYFKGKSVSAEKFKTLHSREQMMNGLIEQEIR